MDNRLSKMLPLLILLVSVCAVFIFLQWWYPYHLFRREQTMIFLMDHEFVSNYFSHSGWLASLTGDFLTQFYYYVAVGPAIISLMLGLLWLLVWVDTKQLINNNIVATLPAILVAAWEFMRECADNYTLASTISMIGAFALLFLVAKVRNTIASPIVAALSLALCYWCFGYSVFVLAGLIALFALVRRQWVSLAIALIVAVFTPKSVLDGTKWWGSPNLAQEHKLAIDSEVYFGNWGKALDLTLSGENTRFSSFYYYLINALMERLPDAVAVRMPKDADALMPTMDPQKSSIDLSALGEAWYYMGDMTSAEHCTIVAMISTTRYIGSRYLRRLAEINLANGDNEAAMKYLRLLSKTICHSKWAESRMPGHENEMAKAKREDVNRYIAPTDTLRYVNDYVKSLRHLVKAHPDNNMAYDFLLCYHLLRRDIKSFIEDFDPQKRMPRLYQEALLIHLMIENASEDEVDKYGIPDSVFEDFYNFNQLMPINDGNRQKVAKQFGNTYWYFYQVIVKK